MIEAVVGLAGSAVLLLGLLLASIGLYGMLRKPSIFEQLHAAGLVTGPGAILVLVASIASGSAAIATSAVLMIVFILVTSSLSTHAIALAAWRGADADAPGRRARHGRTAGAGAVAERPLAAMHALLAYDGSPGAETAAALVASLPWPEGSVVRVVGAADGDLGPFEDSPRPGEHPDERDAAAAAELARVTERLARPGLTVDHVLRRGEPAPAIAEEAATFGADLVVIGSRGLGPMRTLLLGSVAAATIDAAPCSVLVARTPAIGEAVLGVDGSPDAEAAIEAAAGWPILRDPSFAVLAVATGGPGYGGRAPGAGLQSTAERSEQQKLADEAARRLVAAGRRASAHVREGDAAAQVTAFAAARSADLIVLGTRRRTGIRRALLGSVGRSVVSSTPASVLIVKPGPDAGSGGG